MNIQKAKSIDIPQIARIHIDSWRKTYKGVMSESFLQSFNQKKTEKYWFDILKNKSYELLIFKKSNQVTGFMLLNFGQPESNSIELESLYVCPKHQEIGVGSSLIKKVINKLKSRDFGQLYTWVLEDNFKAYRFYKKHNLQYTGEQESHKIDGISTFKLLKLSLEYKTNGKN